MAPASPRPHAADHAGEQLVAIHAVGADAIVRAIEPARVTRDAGTHRLGIAAARRLAVIVVVAVVAAPRPRRVVEIDALVPAARALRLRVDVAGGIAAARHAGRIPRGALTTLRPPDVAATRARARARPTAARSHQPTRATPTT